MKFQETHFDDYVHSTKNSNLHPKLKILNKTKCEFKDIPNVVFYGPAGVGKYSQALNYIKSFSPSELKYEKKSNLVFNKTQYYFKISDIHYEVDMSLLGCNSKTLWHDIYLQIIDIVSTKPEKNGIILCKYFHHINEELLEIFYSYMQSTRLNVINLKYVFITEHLSFIPDNIINCCKVVNVKRPSQLTYTKCIHSRNSIPYKKIQNIKTLYVENENIHGEHEPICNNIIAIMLDEKRFDFVKFREYIYDIFIYNVDLAECIWYIVYNLILQNKITNEHTSPIFIKMYECLQYYNNNYRPIYHIENYLLFIINIIRGYNT